jgi:hypothetical protein
MVNERQPHALKLNAKNEQPSEFILFDTETMPVRQKDGTEHHKLRLGVACYWRRRLDRGTETIEYFDFNTAAAFWDYVDSKTKDGRRIVLVAHNVGFDLRVLKWSKNLRKRKWKNVNEPIIGKPTIIRLRNGHCSLLILDNMNFFPAALAVLGESIGIEKMKMPSFTAPDAEWKPYCKRDVEVMLKAWKLWLGFLKENDLGNFNVTLAGQAFNAFRHRFMKRPVYIHTNERAISLEREAYYGGRTEAFFIGKVKDQKITVLDVNSMYPSVMAAFEYPYKLNKTVMRPTMKGFLRALRHHPVIAKVMIDTPVPIYPKRIDGRLCFPVGRFETVLPSPELTEAFTRGHLKDVRTYAVYDGGGIFRDYVDFFYQARLKYKSDGNKEFAYMCKLLLNSLYGKFGQRNEVWEMIEDDPERDDGVRNCIDADTGREWTERAVLGRVSRLAGSKEGYNSFVAIPAFITSEARLKLWRYIESAGRKNVFYCDTDSIFVNGSGAARLKDSVDPSRLGALAVQSADESLEIRGLKDYTLGGKVKIKGVRRDAVEFEPRHYRQVQFESLVGALRRGRTDEMVTRQVEKEMSGTYLKGTVAKSGRVNPYKLNE